MTTRRFTAEEVDEAVAALAADPERFVHAQELVTHAAPGLHRVLGEAMSSGGWYEASGGQAQRAAAVDDPADRELAIRTLAAEEARLGMLVGVAVGLELRRELDRVDGEETA